MRSINLFIGCSMAMSCNIAGASDFSLSGFGTLAVSHLSTDQAQYRSDTREANGVGKSWDARTDSKIGVRGSYRFDDAISATVTAISRHTVDNNFTPNIEWAYVSYRATPAFELRAGRLGLPAFVASDYLNVNYSMTAVRAPIEVYSQLAPTNFDGVDALWRTNVMGANLTVQPMIGRGDLKSAAAPTGTRMTGKADAYGLNIAAEIGNWTLRAGSIGAKISINSDPTDQLVTNLRAMGISEIADRLAIANRHGSFSGLGASYDNGTLIFQSEYTQRRAYGFVADTNAWYVLGGYRIGQFTPYAIAASQRAVSATSWSDVPAPLKPFVDGALASGNSSQKSWSLGMRWDFMPNVAAKAQFTRITPTHGSATGLLMYDASKGALGSQNLITLSIDTIF